MKRLRKRILALGLIAIMFLRPGLVGAEAKDPHALVAHAGGAIYGFKYTNSLEALQNSYKNGFKLIELDFEWTEDGVPVAIHDWDRMVSRMFGLPARRLTHEEFKTLPTLQDLTMMDLDDVANFLKTTPDSFIVTDVKEDNLRLLEYISSRHGVIKNRFIPQIYSLEEYNLVRGLGYDKIILTLYKRTRTDEEILNFARSNQLYGVTMHYEAAYGDLARDLAAIGKKVYVHPVNDLYIYEDLYQNGVRGLYTDYFQANRFPY